MSSEIGRLGVAPYRGYVDTVRRRDDTDHFVVCPDRDTGAAWLAIDAVEQGTHLRIDMTPDEMRELARNLERMAGLVQVES